MDSPSSKEEDNLPQHSSHINGLDDALPTLPPPTTAGVKRPLPSLLPAFEPSSSPEFSRSTAKRLRAGSISRTDSVSKYPTPVPTSTTGIFSSSPPPPGLPRQRSSVSERVPLQSLRSVVLPDNGEEILMGRSRNSSHYQLSTNKLISRVHVRARYIASATSLEPRKIEITCDGWNGARLHCQGRTWELGKGDTFTSETELSEIMLDVQDARLMIQWPTKDHRGDFSSDDGWNTSDGEQDSNARGLGLQSSPLLVGPALRSPISPTPGAPRSSSSQGSSSFLGGPVKIFEDEPEADEAEAQLEPQASDASFMTQVDSQPHCLDSTASNTQSSSDLSDPEDDADEENDPFFTSFGPSGPNVFGRMTSFTAGGGENFLKSPKDARTPASRVRGRPVPRKASLSPAPRSRSRSTTETEPTPIVNHVINQLAFSRVASTPLLTLFANLPAELKGQQADSEKTGLTKNDLRAMLEGTKCIGEVKREGKDAAGKPLESEFYYLAEGDSDEGRRKAFTNGLGRVGLRNCRKSHKQYFWKRPKTP